MKYSRTLYFPLRLILAIVLGVYMMRLAVGASYMGVFYAAFYGFILFLLFGIPIVRRMGEAASQVFVPNDSQMRIVPPSTALRKRE